MLTQTTGNFSVVWLAARTSNQLLTALEPHLQLSCCKPHYNLVHSSTSLKPSFVAHYLPCRISHTLYAGAPCVCTHCPSKAIFVSSSLGAAIMLWDYSFYPSQHLLLYPGFLSGLRASRQGVRDQRFCRCPGLLCLALAVHTSPMCLCMWVA